MIAQAIENIRKELPQGVKLVAVSKFHPSEAIMEAYGAGQRCFGESRPQEFEAKAKALPEDVFSIGPTVNVDVSPSASVYAGYSFSAGTDSSTTHSANVGFRMRF